jgi:hypothetical protein
VYAGVVIIANMKILGSLNTFNFWTELLIFLSILCYFLVLLFESEVDAFPQLSGVFVPMMSQPITYFAFIFMTFSTFTIDKIIGGIRQAVESHYERKERERRKVD